MDPSARAPPVPGTFPLLELPSELQAPILKRLDRATLFSLAASNRALKDVAIPYLYSEIYLTGTNSSAYRYYQYATTGPRALPENPWYPHAKRLVWEDMVATNRILLEIIDDVGRKLHEFRIARATLPANWLPERLPQLRSLRMLELGDGLSAMGFDDMAVSNTIAANCPSLRTLKDESDPGLINAEGWVRILEARPNLREVTISIGQPRDLQPTAIANMERIGELLAGRRAPSLGLRFSNRALPAAVEILRRVAPHLDSLSLYITDPVEPPAPWRPGAPTTPSAGDVLCSVLVRLSSIPARFTELTSLSLACESVPSDRSRSRTELSSIVSSEPIPSSLLVELFPRCLSLSILHILDLASLPSVGAPWQISSLDWTFPDLSAGDAGFRPTVFRSLAALPSLRSATLRVTPAQDPAYGYKLPPIPKPYVPDLSLERLERVELLGKEATLHLLPSFLGSRFPRLESITGSAPGPERGELDTVPAMLWLVQREGVEVTDRRVTKRAPLSGYGEIPDRTAFEVSFSRTKAW